jgi:hypothetical protein
MHEEAFFAFIMSYAKIYGNLFLPQIIIYNNKMMTTAEKLEVSFSKWQV